MVSIFLSLILSAGLAEDNDPAGLSRIIAEAGALPQSPRLPWYGAGVQALGRATQELTAALHPARPLSEAFDALSASSRKTLLQHVSAETFADHIFGGPLAPAGKLAPRPMPQVLTDSALIYSDLKLEESIDPAAALREALGSVAPDASLCLSLPSEAACPPDTVQRLARRDLDALCAQCDPPRTAHVLGLDSDHWVSPDRAQAWLLLATPLNISLNKDVDAKVNFRPWTIPPAAFSYASSPQHTASASQLAIRGRTIAAYGPYLPVPAGEWRVTWQLKSTTRLSRSIQILATRFDVLEHRGGVINKISETRATSNTTTFLSRRDSVYEFRILGRMKASHLEVLFSGVTLEKI
ncbi:hypothetical protein D3C72_821670 [compost metagenome]